MHSCFFKLFEINVFPSHRNQPSFLSLELIDRFLYIRKTNFKLIKIQLRDAKMFVIRVELGTLATSEMEIFVTIVKEWKLSKMVSNSSILDVTLVLDPVCVV